MVIVSKIQHAFKVGGFKTFVNQLSSYIETRFLVLLFLVVPAPYFTMAREAACVKIIMKQSGDVSSIEMLEYLIPVINYCGSRSDKCLNIVVPNYLLDAFSQISKIIAKKKVHFSSVDKYIESPDFILCNLLMLNQIPSSYSSVMKKMSAAFKNGAYIVFCKEELEVPSVSIEGIDDYISAISDNKKKGTKLYVRENAFNFVVREGTMDYSIINEVKQEYLERLTQDGFKGKNIIDLGGHIGSFSIQISEYLLPDAMVICIEPSPYNVNLIKENIELNQLGNIIDVKQAAVSSKPGKATLYISSDNTGGNKLDMVEPSSKEAIEVDVVALNDIINKFGDEYIDLLKIDVEGSENPILLSCGDLLESKVKLIIGEAGGSPYGDGIDIVNFLKSHGFDVDYEGNADQLIFYAKNKSFF